MRINSKEELENFIKNRAATREVEELFVANRTASVVNRYEFGLFYAFFGKRIRNGFDDKEYFIFRDQREDLITLNIEIIFNPEDEQFAMFTTEEEAIQYNNPIVRVEINLNEMPEWVKLLVDNQKINAIKALRSEMYVEDHLSKEKFHIGIKVAKDFIEAFENAMTVIR